MYHKILTLNTRKFDVSDSKKTKRDATPRPNNENVPYTST